ncbi:MAG: pyrrolo-quinoline quinone [Planctomycetales bacterium 12-60-4]|nr:MAG: pyrrolo-quinoline quinone [Planctomycetales bacterium 12-60-4]
MKDGSMRQFLAVWTLLCLTTLEAAEPSALVWPAFRGTGNSRAEAARVPITWQLRGRSAESWTIRLPGYGQSSPVVWGGRVYVTAVSGDEKEHLHVLAMDLKTGRLLWQRDFEGTQHVPDADAVSRGAPTPCIDNDRLYVMFESGDLFALSHAGDLQWQRSIVRDYGEFQGPHGYASSPVLAADRLVVQVCHSGPSYILAVDKSTGQNLWKVDHPSQTAWSTPTVFQQDAVTGVIVSSSGSVRAYDVENGRELWFVTGIQGNTTASPTVSDGVVLIGGSSERRGPPPPPGVTTGSLAIRLGGEGDVSATHVLWKSPKVAAGYASPLVADGRAYFIGRLGTMQCVDVRTGDVVWQHRLPDTAWASPLLANGHIFVFCKDGTVSVLAPGPELREMGESTISSTDIIYGVAVTDDAWIVRTGRGLTRITHQGNAE